MAKQSYTAEAIEVLTGLDPVRKRPGMYTDTTRPNHLALEVIDNSVDEALAGFAHEIAVIHHGDGSLSVIDDGRGMPTDKHPTEKVSGVELILTRLHAGAKFSNKNYQFSGGLHGVGVSVVNALSQRLEVTVFREDDVFTMVFEDGEVVRPLRKQKGKSKRTGTAIRFWPKAKYFDYPQFSIPKLKHALQAKAVLCPGLTVSFLEEASEQKEVWHYQGGCQAYLMESCQDKPWLLQEPFSGDFAAEKEAVTWAVLWFSEKQEGLMDSYVNLIPTPQGGTHVNGFRMGLLEALRDFCEQRHLLPRGMKLAPEDIWAGCSYVLSLKMQEPQFSGQTKERLTARQSAVFVEGVIKDAFSLWLHQHVAWGEQLAAWVIEQAERRLQKTTLVARKKAIRGPTLPGKLTDCMSQEAAECELFLVEGDSAGGTARQARDKAFQAVMPLRGKILNTWEVAHRDIIRSQEVQDIARAIGMEPGSTDLTQLRYGKICILADADFDGQHIATLLCALFVKHFPLLVREGHLFVALPPLYRIDVGKEVYYVLDEDEKAGLFDRFTAEKKTGKVNVQRFKGLGEMNPVQLRETTMAKETRRLLQLRLPENEEVMALFDLLLGKKRASDRRQWLETKGNLAHIL